MIGWVVADADILMLRMTQGTERKIVHLNEAAQMLLRNAMVPLPQVVETIQFVKMKIHGVMLDWWNYVVLIGFV
jgi:hypothetical protein